MRPKLRIDVSPLKEVLEPGDSIPSWYGVAFIEEPWGNAVCYPFGLHIAVRWARLLYEAIQIPRRTWWEKRLMDASDLAYDRGVVIGKSMGTNIDGKQVFSKSQLNRHIAIAVDRNNAIARQPAEQAFHDGWNAALAKIETFLEMDAETRAQTVAMQEAERQKRQKGQEVRGIDENEAQARRAESDKYSEELQRHAEWQA